MARVEVAKVSKKKLNVRELLATICYFYPQYTLYEASQMPAKDVSLLIKVAMRERSRDWYNQTQIAAAPHTKRGSGVNTLSKAFRKDMK